MARAFVQIRDRILLSRYLPLYLAIAGIALTLPALWSGWQQDDLIHRYYLLGNPDPQGEIVAPLDMFKFLDGDSANTTRMMNLGVLPWWTDPHIRLAFWRPLSALTHWLDYRLWPESSLLMHAQSLLWFGGLIAVMALLYRRLMGAAWVGGLAALLYALDDAHGLPAGWLANRNALVAAFFGVLALLLYDRWRRDASRTGAVLGPLCFALGLLAGETALAVMAYIIAYAFFLDEGNIRHRFVSLIPYGVIALAWFSVYHQLGYGTEGSDFYVDPLSQPLAYLGSLLERGPILLADQFALPPSSFYLFLSAGAVKAIWVWAIVVCVVIGILLSPLVRQNRLAQFWLAGMLLSLPIVTATTPHSRLLLFAGLGGMGLIALWIQRYKEGVFSLADGKGTRRFYRLVMTGAVVIHLVLAPLMLPLNAMSAATMEPFLQEPARAVDLGSGIEEKDLILVNPPIVFLTNYFILVRSLEGLPVPQRQRVLAPGDVTLQVSRKDAHTLIVTPDGGFLRGPFDNVFRSRGTHRADAHGG
ncbi:MAG: hypothetical protein H6Q32_1324 [Bacteroidetes bacterium]|nr:hypothetical protein [Bacteroidota bacterium]